MFYFLACTGLEYLHDGCKPPIVHKDMKSSNILFNENHEPKITDFGISGDLETDSYSSTAYLDPE